MKDADPPFIFRDRMPKICHINQQPSGYLSIQTVQMQHKKVAQNNLRGIDYLKQIPYQIVGSVRLAVSG